MKYAVYNVEKGYLCNDEDMMNETSYDQNIDEYTILFDKEQDALFNCGVDEIVAMVEAAPMIDWCEHGNMLACDECAKRPPSDSITLTQ